MKKGIRTVFSVWLVLGVLMCSAASAGTSIGTESRGAAEGSLWSRRLLNVPELVFRQ